MHNENLTIKDIKGMKVALEHNITALLDEFLKETGLLPTVLTNDFGVVVQLNLTDL